MEYPNDLHGPIFWHMIHSIAFSSRFVILPSVMAEALQLIDSVMKLFPCIMCRSAYLAYLPGKGSAESYVASPNSLTIIRNYKLFRWTWYIHNQTNVKLNKRRVTYSEAYTKFQTIESDR